MHATCPTWRRRAWLPLAVALVLVSAGCDRAKPREDVAHAAERTEPAKQEHESTPVVALPSGRSIADVAAKVMPSVVSVMSEREATEPAFPLFPFFFGPGGPGGPSGPDDSAPPSLERSLGSGVIVSSDGVIVTNSHVVADAQDIRVSLSDGRELPAKLVGTDAPSDVAVLRVEAKDLPALPIADAEKLRIGDLVLAIGSPFGLRQTVTMGIVSAVGRANMGITDYEDFIQTDAAINPGNSGGALVTMRGELAGINTAIVSRTGGYQGVGFAIPSTMAMQVKDAILEHGKVVRGWLGVAVQDLTPDIAKALRIDRKRGALVSFVNPNGPADAAGVRRGDVIVAMDGTEAKDASHLRGMIAMAGKDKSVELALLRKGETKTVNAKLGELPSTPSEQEDVRPEAGAPTAVEGMAVRELDEALRARLNVPEGTQGVVVTGISPRAKAARAGLRPGDVVVEVDGKPTPNVAAFRKAAEAAKDSMLLLLLREGVTIYLVVSE